MPKHPRETVHAGEPVIQRIEVTGDAPDRFVADLVKSIADTEGQAAAEPPPDVAWPDSRNSDEK